jgi:hypothetical protein
LQRVPRASARQDVEEPRLRSCPGACVECPTGVRVAPEVDHPVSTVASEDMMMVQAVDPRRKRCHQGRQVSRCAIFTALLTIVLTFTVPTSADAAGCSGTAYAPPALKVWQANYGPPASANNVRSGLQSNFRVTYKWRVDGNVSRTIAVRALGFQKGRQKWFNLGMSSRRGSGSVPWGTVTAVPKIMVASSGAGGLVKFTC